MVNSIEIPDWDYLCSLLQVNTTSHEVPGRRQYVSSVMSSSCLPDHPVSEAITGVVCRLPDVVQQSPAAHSSDTVAALLVPSSSFVQYSILGKARYFFRTKSRMIKVYYVVILSKTNDQFIADLPKKSSSVHIHVSL